MKRKIMICGIFHSWSNRAWKMAKPISFIILFAFLSNVLLYATTSSAKDTANMYSLDNVSGWNLRKVSAVPVNFKGRKALKVELLPSVIAGTYGVDYIDRDTVAVIPGTEGFRDGVIEVDVIGALSPTAPDYARGFIGVAFRVTGDLSSFGAYYIRPTNARADDQIRRNHSMQYYSFPDYPFSRLRKEEPERYEAYSDLDMNDWTHLKIEVRQGAAKFYINHAAQPSLIVSDLKLPENTSGSVAFWTEIGTEAYFSNLQIHRY